MGKLSCCCLSGCFTPARQGLLVSRPKLFDLVAKAIPRSFQSSFELRFLSGQVFFASTQCFAFDSRCALEIGERSFGLIELFAIRAGASRARGPRLGSRRPGGGGFLLFRPRYRFTRPIGGRQMLRRRTSALPYDFSGTVQRGLDQLGIGHQFRRSDREEVSAGAPGSQRGLSTGRCDIGIVETDRCPEHLESARRGHSSSFAPGGRRPNSLPSAYERVSTRLA